MIRSFDSSCIHIHKSIYRFRTGGVRQESRTVQILWRHRPRQFLARKIGRTPDNQRQVPRLHSMQCRPHIKTRINQFDVCLWLRSRRAISSTQFRVFHRRTMNGVSVFAETLIYFDYFRINNIKCRAIRHCNHSIFHEKLHQHSVANVRPKTFARCMGTLMQPRTTGFGFGFGFQLIGFLAFARRRQSCDKSRG